ncbi:MFS transporter [Denitrobaculum tricleocarpae]|uniref:MFS transporter n=1 Tax=Denitrobaculum tricleocarpae TaxID=2591009 RepID=A0A545TF44_9PROT|nr:MFS transporter [Denitrobaculum tricleocarpae]TQV75854.1 MFS transporter [Denitrobaculum tricleocarpae]
MAQTDRSSEGQADAAASVTPSSSPTLEKLPLGIMAGYGFLAFPLAATVLSLQVFLPTYYAQATGLSLTMIGGVLLIARLWDTITDPIVGYLSEKTPARLGRRRLWVLIGSPLIALSVWMLFQPPENPSAFYLLGWAILIYLAGTAVVVPTYAWGAELSPDYHERSRISGTRVLFGLLGSLAALTLPLVLGMDAGTTAANDAPAGEAAENLGAILQGNSVMIVVTLALAVAVCCLFVPDNGKSKLPTGSILASFSLFKEAPPVRKLMVSYLLNGIANALPATLFLLFATHVLGAADQAGFLLVVYFGVCALSVPVWVVASKRWSKHGAWRIAMTTACLAFVWVPFLGTGDTTAFLVIVVITGIAAGADLALPAALQADLVDWDEDKTGYRRAGIFFAVWGTASKLTFAIAIGLAFPLLDLAGFSATGENTAVGLLVLSLLYGGLPVALKISAVLLMRNYPVTHAVHDAIRIRLAQRESNGQSEGLNPENENQIGAVTAVTGIEKGFQPAEQR